MILLDQNAGGAIQCIELRVKVADMLRVRFESAASFSVAQPHSSAKRLNQDQDGQYRYGHRAYQGMYVAETSLHCIDGCWERNAHTMLRPVFAGINSDTVPRLG
jgi:hypothetical protein